ncbi:hypothetical protein acsn021_33360 [Anaerocolumna cellulosilytica]|uniref:Uncharacterized protein n=1 Tax=Anaerocolumna cellulosilytica TaxID=433286 RepID=A0A6S6R6Y3_9FIRM|nr:hypothetical protein [Anaerocolumna cellulosilytica]MBB5196840.1 hypothetical protein [Anaerocolumna cellulosilytica]BCJ95767.1 hypothetical protein acsn021_33360 [Anaerocolumna cellulosilytica]
MYFDHSKRSYYRFPSKNRVTDFDSQTPYYFPDKYSFRGDDLMGSLRDANYNNYEDVQDNQGASF